MNHLATLGK